METKNIYKSNSSTKKQGVMFYKGKVLMEQDCVYSVIDTRKSKLLSHNGENSSFPLVTYVMDINENLRIVQAKVSYNHKGMKFRPEKFGIYDLKNKRFVANCVFDFVDITKSFGNCIFVDLYIGPNSYTLNLMKNDIKPVINPYISKRTLDILTAKPTEFLRLNSVYFAEIDGSFNDSNVADCLKATKIGIAKIEKNILKSEPDFKKAINLVSMFRDKIAFDIENKIEKERKMIENGKPAQYEMEKPF